ncbi:MAG: substrate-binding periplasmic protein [Planctomycetota bacterium]|jgi:ABC-type amino acid transport substrate-binding protein
MKILIFLVLFVSVPVLNAGELVVALSEVDYPPFYFSKNNKLQGSSLEIAESIAKNLGYRLVYKRYPWARVLENLKVGDVDMVVHFFNTAERAPYVIHTGVPHIFESSCLFVRKDSNITFSGNLRKLKFHSFYHVRGYSHGRLFDNAKYLKKEQATSEENLIKMLINKRFDIGVGDKIKFLKPVIDNSPCYMAFSRAKLYAKGLAALFTEEIVAFKKTDKFKNILKKYDMVYPEFKNLPERSK